MAVSTQDLASLIRQQIESFQAPQRMVDVGTVMEVGDGIARVAGLTNAAASEIVEFANGIPGIVFNLTEDSVGIIIMGEYSDISEGDLVRSTGRIVSVPVAMPWWAAWSTRWASLSTARGLSTATSIAR
jgi:F-type H+-transporting ATPase subunit alpha